MLFETLKNDGIKRSGKFKLRNFAVSADVGAINQNFKKTLNTMLISS